MTFSDQTLNLRPRWFTRAQWADGSAEQELRREYREAVAQQLAIENAKPASQRKAERTSRHFVGWFEDSLKQEGTR